MTIQQAIRVPMMQFATLHVLAATAICSGSGTSEGHAILRFSPATCLHELIEHCAFSVHVLPDSLIPPRNGSGKSAQDRHTASFVAQSCGISASLAVTIYLTFSSWTISWTILFCWLYTLRSLTLLLLPPLPSLQDAVPPTEAARIKQQVTAIRAIAVHLTSCAMIAARNQASGYLVIGGGILITLSALGVEALEQRNPADSLLPVPLGGLFHHILIGAAFLVASVGEVYDDDVNLAVGLFDVAWLSVPLSRGSHSMLHAMLFAATTWSIGFIFYGMATY